MSGGNDGGSVFPEINTRQGFYGNELYPDVSSSGGMSLRDWFAGMALQGIASSESEEFGHTDLYVGLDGKETHRPTGRPLKNGAEDYTQSEVILKISRTKHQQEAEEAYKRADAMLAERERKNEQPGK